MRVCCQLRFERARSSALRWRAELATVLAAAFAMASEAFDRSAALAAGRQRLANPALVLRALEAPRLRILRISECERAEVRALSAVLQDDEAVELQTCGDGECAIHALRGSVDQGSCHFW